MGFLRQMFGLESDGDGKPASASNVPIVRADITKTITTSQELEEALRTGNISSSGQAVTTDSALRVATVFACVRRRAGAIANTPIGVKRRIDERTRADASEHPVWMMLNRKPNGWQTPSQFKRMMEGHIQLRGNAYAFLSKNVRGQVIGAIPLHPDRVEPRLLDDMTKEYTWTRRDGRRVVFKHDEVLHMMGLSLDGIKGLSTLSYAREAIGLSLAQEAHGSSVFRNGANVSGAFKLPAGKTLSDPQKDSLRTQMDDFRQGGAREGKVVILEDGLEFQQMALSAEDAQWLDSRKFSRTDICMFFDVPPHIIGITDANTQLGSSIEQQTQGYVTFSLEDSFVSWEESIGLQCLDWVVNPELYARFNRNALVRADIKTRWGAYVQAMQWGVFSPNEVRELEDENPRDGGDVYYPPPNMTQKDKTGDANVNP